MKKLLFVCVLFIGSFTAAAASDKINTPADLAEALEQIKKEAAIHWEKKANNLVGELDKLITEANSASTNTIEPQLQDALNKLVANLSTIFPEGGYNIINRSGEGPQEFRINVVLDGIARGINPFKTKHAPHPFPSQGASSSTQPKVESAPMSETDKQFFATLRSRNVGDLVSLLETHDPKDFWYATMTLDVPLTDGRTVKVTNIGALSAASMKTQNDMLEILLEKGFPLTVNSRHESALHIAAGRKDGAKLNMLINKFVPSPEVKATPIDPRAQKNAEGRTPYDVWMLHTKGAADAKAIAQRLLPVSSK